MANFVRSVPVQFSAAQFLFSGTENEARVAREGSENFTDLEYWNFFDKTLANEVKSAWLKINPNDPTDVVLNVRVRWYSEYMGQDEDSTFALREGDWLVEDFSDRPIYRVMTPTEFATLNATPLTK